MIVYAGNGFGSTNVTIRRFTTIQEDTGADITFTQSATLGDIFTINTAGLYSITYQDGKGANSGMTFGASVNSSQLNEDIAEITAADRLGYVATALSDTVLTFSTTVLLAATDVIRAHTGGTVNRTDARCRFAIRRVA